MQILLIVSKPVVKDLLSINIKSFLGVDVIVRQNSDEAIDLLAILPEIDLIISNDDNADAMTNYLVENKKNTNLIILGHARPDLAQKYSALQFLNESDWEEVVALSAKTLGISDDILKRKKNSDYTPIPVGYFLNLDSSCSDVYIRIQKSDNDFQFVKRIHRGDVFSKAVISRYIDQNLKYFYIPSDQLQQFSIFVSNQLVRKLSEPIEIDEKIEVLGNSFNIATKEILRIGFNSSTIQLTETLVSSIVDSFMAEDVVSPLLRKILNSKTGYIYQHAHLTSIVASEIIKNLGIDDKQLHEKMAFASVFKDISLANNEDLAMITSFEELENADLDDEEWDQVFNHALEGAVMVRQFPEAPLDIDYVIKHHHGVQNGKGFSISIKEDNFDTDSLIFIISVEFVNELLRFKIQGGTPRPLIDELYKKYTNSESIRIIKALEKTLKKSVNGGSKS
ncbi:HD domain-containing phosphohydrolase [Bacteriovorax sp. Seq25_V]|uniref:HD domain-containing phosphohydrolase n=1 Tax=Bacteriovorax sp. Seq25_V TaxID=1201288 RepID=UPI00038A2392|nr:HD domain-containing phosphohydrolase [Bacteriovorax sp. Seq25_V]EQC44382.1 hypothetical protein M900_A0463 [Bacteriovorax sp. Seq25_V]